MFLLGRNDFCIFFYLIKMRACLSKLTSNRSNLLNKLLISNELLINYRRGDLLERFVGGLNYLKEIKF